MGAGDFLLNVIPPRYSGFLAVSYKPYFYCSHVPATEDVINITHKNVDREKFYLSLSVIVLNDSPREPYFQCHGKTFGGIGEGQGGYNMNYIFLVACFTFVKNQIYHQNLSDNNPGPEIPGPHLIQDNIQQLGINISVNCGSN